MPQFNALKYAYPSHRNVVFARKGMASSTSPIASQVGLEILKSGGNAMDAAIAMATTLPATAWGLTALPWCGAPETRSSTAWTVPAWRPWP